MLNPFHLPRPKLTPKEARRVLYAFFALAVASEAGLAIHAWSVHDAITSGLVVSAWAREYVIGAIEHIGESLV